MTRSLLPYLSLLFPLLLLAVAAEEGLPALSSLLVPLAIIILLIALNGFFVMAEFALIGVRPSQMAHLADEGNRIAKYVVTVLRSIKQQNRFLATAQLGITLASLGLGMYGEVQISRFIEPYLARLLNLDPHAAIITTIGSLLAVSLLTYLHIVYGEMIPKSLALIAPDRALFAIVQPMRLIETILAIPVQLLNGLGNLLLRLLRVPPATGHARLHSPEELELIVSDSVVGGLVDEREQRIIQNIFDFGERYAHQVMTPRPRLEAVAHDTPLPELLKQLAESSHSRFPVYRGDLDHIIGVIHVKDLVCHRVDLKDNFDLRLLLRPLPVVPEHYLVAKLLVTLKRQRIHMALVLDEFGGTAGIVTLEDLVEEVVGEVQDEFDLEREPIVELAPGVLEVAGNFLIDDLKMYIDLGDEDTLPDVETVSGLIVTGLGRLPQVGDKLTYRNDIQFTVLAVEGLTVARTQIEYPAA